MSAHIRLYGEKHILGRADLVAIADAVGGPNPSLMLAIWAYLGQEEDDKVADNPLRALDQLGQDMLVLMVPIPGVRQAIWEKGDLMIALAKDWPCDTDCVDGALQEIYTLCADCQVWVAMLRSEGCQDGANCVEQVNIRAAQIWRYLREDHLATTREI